MTDEFETSHLDVGLSEGPEERLDREIQEKFATLGRFVQEFELMVRQVRRSCRELISQDPDQHKLLNVLLHHKAFTASPLFEVMRGMYAQLLSDQENRIQETERGVIRAVLKQMAADYEELVKSRNDILHGTWNIGWFRVTSHQWEEMFVEKHKVTKDGLAIADTPKNMKELDQLAQKCAALNEMIVTLLSVFHDRDPEDIEEAFQKVDNRWELTPMIVARFRGE